MELKDYTVTNLREPGFQKISKKSIDAMRSSLLLSTEQIYSSLYENVSKRAQEIFTCPEFQQIVTNILINYAETEIREILNRPPKIRIVSITAFNCLYPNRQQIINPLTFGWISDQTHETATFNINSKFIHCSSEDTCLKMESFLVISMIHLMCHFVNNTLQKRNGEDVVSNDHCRLIKKVNCQLYGASLLPFTDACLNNYEIRGFILRYSPFDEERLVDNSFLDTLMNGSIADLRKKAKIYKCDITRMPHLDMITVFPDCKFCSA